MPIPADEQETVVNYSRSDKYMSVYTSDSTQMTKLDKKVKNYPDTWSINEIIKDKDGNVVGKIYSAPKKMLSFRNEKNKSDGRVGNPNGTEALKKWREEQRNKKE